MFNSVETMMRLAKDKEKGNKNNHNMKSCYPV